MTFPGNIFNSHPKEDGNFFLGITEILGFKTRKLDLYKNAFLHRSLNLKDKK